MVHRLGNQRVPRLPTLWLPTLWLTAAQDAANTVPQASLALPSGTGSATEDAAQDAAEVHAARSAGCPAARSAAARSAGTRPAGAGSAWQRRGLSATLLPAED